MDLKPNTISGAEGVIKASTVREDADFAEFVERCHDALRQHTGGAHGRSLNCGRALQTSR
jgi:hypothetical protein